MKKLVYRNEDWSHSGSASLSENNERVEAQMITHHSTEPRHMISTLEVTGIEPGIYTLYAQTKRSGVHHACYISANEERLTSIPLSQDWVRVAVRGIEVVDGTLSIQLHSNIQKEGSCSLGAIEMATEDKPYTLLKGGDVSELPRIEENGGVYYDQDEARDGLTILKDYGNNIVRIRLYNDPGNKEHYPANQLDPRGYQNLAHSIKLAKRAKEMGYKIQFTFHYSDYWSNGEQQFKPHAWESLNFAQLKDELYRYTSDVLQQLDKEGVMPEYISIGNEIQGGICYPDGSIKQWDQLAQLLNAGARAVREHAEDARIILHLDGATQYDKYRQFFGHCEKYEVDYDIIGTSYYPFWTQRSVDDLVEFCNVISSEFDKDILVMETGYNWNETTGAGMPGQLANNGPEPFASTPLGQKEYMIRLFNGIKNVEKGRCLGVLYWDPVMITVPNVGWQNGAPNVVDNTTLFDFGGRALPALHAYKYNN